MSEEKESPEKTRTRQASNDSDKSSARTLSSESALERLQNGLEKLDKTTIELRRSPRKTNDLPEDPTAPVSFPCKKCSFVVFTTFADLIEHMMLSHDPPADLPGFRKIERKSYDCPTCKFPFPSAFKMKQHADKKECFEVADDDQLATPTLSRKDKRGFHLCQMCDFKCKDGNLMQQHLREGHYPNRDCFVSADPRLRRLGEEFRKNEIDLLNQTNSALAEQINSSQQRRPAKPGDSPKKTPSSSQSPGAAAIRRLPPFAPSSQIAQNHPSGFAREEFEARRNQNAAQSALESLNLLSNPHFSSYQNLAYQLDQNRVLFNPFPQLQSISPQVGHFSSQPNSSLFQSVSGSNRFHPPFLSQFPQQQNLSNGINPNFQNQLTQQFYLEQIRRMFSEQFFNGPKR